MYALVYVIADIVTFHDASLTVLADIVTFDDAPVTVKAEEDKVDLKSTRLALYIVLPIFLLCFGGSAIGYCLNRIYRNCKYVTHARAATASTSHVTAIQLTRSPPPRSCCDCLTKIKHTTFVAIEE